MRPSLGIGGTGLRQGRRSPLLGLCTGWAVPALEAISTSNVTTGSLFRYNDGQYFFNLNGSSSAPASTSCGSVSVTAC